MSWRRLAVISPPFRAPRVQKKRSPSTFWGWFEANGTKAVRQDVAVDRPNAVGIVKGDGMGLSLGFNGHTDTSFAGTGADLRMVANIEPDTELKGKIVGNKVQGLGISNMKGGLAAFMTAGKAVKNSGVKLKGDVILACVVGEISRSPIGAWQSQEYRGEGIGTHHLLTHGMHSDYAVCCDGSDLNIVWTQTGVVQIRITTFSEAEAAWSSRRAEFPMEKVNAIVKMTRIIAALEQWGATFEEKYIYNSPTGPLWPKVNIGAIEGGAPYRPNYFPGVCSIYVDVRMPPQVRPVAIQRGVEQVLNNLGVNYEMDVYKSLLGYEGKNVAPLVQSAEEVFSYLFGGNIKPESPDRASIWTDTNIAWHSGDQDWPARPAHQCPQRRDRHRRNGQGGANLRANGAGYFQQGEGWLAKISGRGRAPRDHGCRRDPHCCSRSGGGTSSADRGPGDRCFCR